MFEPLDSKLHMSTADHPQTDGQTARVNRVIADALHTIASPKEWSKRLPFVEFAINISVHASTGETPFYVNGLRHPRTPVWFVRSLSGGVPSLRSEQMLKSVMVSPMLWQKLALVTLSVPQWSRHKRA